MENLNLGFAGGLVLVGSIIGYFLRRLLAQRQSSSLEHKAEKKLEEAKAIAQRTILDAQNKAAGILADSQQEERRRKKDIERLEERLLNKEDILSDERKSVERELNKIKEEKVKLSDAENEIKDLRFKIVEQLEKTADLTKDEARAKIFEEFRATHRQEMAEEMTKLERDKKNQIEAKTIDIITSAIHRYARNSVNDVTTSVVHIGDEELKGKIIGREGRNIRTFERLTGVEVIVDETPDSVLLSSFDPMRRELAKLSLEKLIKDGRIQPAKIEEKVEEAKQELDDRIKKIGEDAAYEVGILDLPKEIVYLLGRLNYRTSYGQNVLIHSIEMAHIAGMMAAELGLNVAVTKKAALLHDIGKAISHEVEGTHVELGRKLLKKYGIGDEIIQGMESHHEEYPFSTPESYVVTAADAISAGRPGARRDTLEKYIKRLEDIEKAVNAFDGVRQSYAVSAGREVRVFVVPEKIDDFGALELAKKIANKIQSDVQYPGEIKVTVIREVKAVEYAK